MESPRFLALATFTVTGFVVWAAQFTVLYGVAALVCAGRLSNGGLLGASTITAVGVAATAVGLLAIGVAALLAPRVFIRIAEDAPADRFLAALTRTIAVLAAISVVYTGLPVLLSPGCAP